MASTFDGKGDIVGDDGTAVVALRGEQGKRRGDIDHGQRTGGIGDGLARLQDLLDQPGEDVEFQRNRSVARLGNLRFKLTQFDGGETHGVGHGLTVDEDVAVQLVGMGLGRFDVVTQHVVVADFQRADAGALLIA